MDKIKKIADRADMIVSGYAFTRENGQIRILNLNNTEKAMVISEDGKVLETTMDDIKIRNAFGLDEREKVKASRIIRDALGAKLIKPVDPSTAPRYMKYVPYWA